MTSLNELRKQIASEKKKQQKLRMARLKVDEKSKLKRQLFYLKHGRKIKLVKKVGKTFKRASSNLSNSVSSVGSSFSQQRKKGKGIGGFMQRIADNQ